MGCTASLRMCGVGLPAVNRVHCCSMRLFDPLLCRRGRRILERSQVRKGRQQRKLRLQAEDGVKRLEGEAAAAHAEVQVRMRRAADRMQRG